MSSNDAILAKLESIERLTLLGAKSILDVGEASLLTGISKHHLYKLTSQREIPHYKKGNKLYFRRDEVEAWMLERPIKTKKEIEQEATTYVALNPMRRKGTSR